jgi:hypothetical protein
MHTHGRDSTGGWRGPVYSLRMIEPLSAVVGLLRWLLLRLERILKKRDEAQLRRDEAAETFRGVVYRELSGLYPHPSDWPKATGIEHRLRRVFPALQEAVVAFRSYVPENNRADFDQAWLYYHASTKREIDQDYTHYMNFGSATLVERGQWFRYKQDGKVNFKRNVDRLLRYAR